MLIGLDWLILAVLVGGLIHGYVVGAVRQIGSLVGLLLALLVSVEFMDPVGVVIVSSLGLAESLAPLAGFVVVFLGVYLLVLIVARLMEQILDSLSLSFVNQVTGGAVGIVKTALLMSLLFLVLSGVELPAQETRQQSALYRPVARLLPRAIEATEDWLPAAKKAADDLGRRVRSRMDSVPDSQMDSVPGSSSESGPTGQAPGN